MQIPKNGACIAAENSLDSNNTSKLGAVAAKILLRMNRIISANNSGLGENLSVTIRSIGPKMATLIAYTVNSKPVVDTSTFKSSAN
ncbi:hypothetical protein JCM19039_4273 [Geomicrobium sp. JCM 19039]|nr:hypothetical protein JCM19039_4273 [Geomicrobium sp. JCM 19039]